MTWIISAIKSEVKTIQKNEFSKHVNIKSSWKDYNITNLYESSYTTITNYNKIFYQTVRVRDKDYNNVWLVTNKYNSGVPKYVANIQGGKLFFNNHLVYILKGNMIKYAFINYNNLFGGVDKLRWTSIKDVKQKSDYIFILHKIGNVIYSDLVVVNIETGDILFGNNGYDYKFDKTEIYNYSNESRIDYDSLINNFKF